MANPDDIELVVFNEDEHKTIQDEHKTIQAELNNIQNEGIKSLLQNFIKIDKIQQANEGLILYYTIGLVIDDNDKRNELYRRIIENKKGVYDNIRQELNAL